MTSELLLKMSEWMMVLPSREGAGGQGVRGMSWTCRPETQGRAPCTDGHMSRQEEDEGHKFGCQSAGQRGEAQDRLKMRSQAQGSQKAWRTREPRWPTKFTAQE